MSGPEDETPVGGPAPLPPPQYGEYAPPGYVSPAAHQAFLAAMPPPAAPGATVPEWDRRITLSLLVVGAFGAVVGASNGIALESDFPRIVELYGLADAAVPAGARAAAVTIVVTNVALYLTAFAWSWRRLKRGLRAFWVPLSAGILATIVQGAATYLVIAAAFAQQ